MMDSSDELTELLTLTVTVDKHGTRIYRNSHDQIHRRLGPAVECNNGYRNWRLNGELHRTTGPAVEWPNGTKEWWLNGQQLTEQEFHDNLK